MGKRILIFTLKIPINLSVCSCFIVTSVLYIADTSEFKFFSIKYFSGTLATPFLIFNNKIHNLKN